MKGCHLEKWLILGSVLYALFISNLVAAQVVGDTTLPTGERSQVTGNPNFQIDGGATRGGNLFHSFSDFSVPTGGSAYVNNAADVQNIFSRVTGGSISNIDGVIRANGTANLFVLNPNGIVFGPNARLNVGGSFIATTANSINFADNFQYSATNPQTTPLLTVSVPVGLQMGANPGPIAMQGVGYNLSATFAFFTPWIRGNASTGLEVPTGQTLALLGGDIDIQGGVLTAEQGRIELGSARNEEVSLGNGFVFSYPNVQNFGSIRLSQQALADASGGGRIQVQGDQVSLANGSMLLIQNQGTQAGGSIRVNATESLELSGASLDAGFSGGLFSETVGVGSGADITVSTRQLAARDGTGITARSYGPARAGDVTVQASGLVQLTGFLSTNPIIVSSISTYTFGAGDAGDITVSAREINLLDGAGIASPTFGIGRGGNITVNAFDLIQAIGQSSSFAQSGLNTNAYASKTGDAGQITVNTSRLVIQDGASISTSTVGSGNAGSITIDARESVEIIGRPPAPALPSVIGSSAPIATEIQRIIFGLPDRPSGNSGSVTISTPRLIIRDEAEATVSNDGTGNAGTLRVNANSIVVDRDGSITAATASGEGGNLDLNVRDFVLLQNNSQITTSAGGTGNGGDIDITARSLLALNGSQLSAAAAGTGNAGNIVLSADTVGLSSGGRLLTTTSSSGRAGNITVKTPDLQLSGATSGLFAGTTSAGDAGNLTIQPRGNGQSVRVNLQDGAQISASTSSRGNGGELTITAPESITLTGNGSVIAAETGGSGRGGNLNLQTGTLNIQNQAQVTVSSEGTGSAGNLFVDANQIYLNNGGRIRADTSGGGGDINLRSPLILLRNGSSITTNATGSNIPGGDINIDTDNLVAVPKENSDISANSANFRGGNVTVRANGIFGIEFQEQLTPLSDITATGASSEFSGTVQLITPGIDPARGLAELPTEVVDATGAIATGCRDVQGSSFVVTGRGGLPPTPQQALGDDPRWRDWRTPAVVSPSPNTTANGTLPRSTNPASSKSALVEATGWVIEPDGQVILTASVPNVTSPNRWGQPVNCDGS